MNNTSEHTPRVDTDPDFQRYLEQAISPNDRKGLKGMKCIPENILLRHEPVSVISRAVRGGIRFIATLAVITAVNWKDLSTEYEKYKSQVATEPANPAPIPDPEEEPKRTKPNVVGEVPPELKPISPGEVESEAPTPEAPTPEAPTPVAPKPEASTPEAPTPEAPKPRTQAPKPRTQAPKPRVQAPTPRVQAPTPRVQAPTPRVQAPTPKPAQTESRGNVAAIRAELRENGYRTMVVKDATTGVTTIIAMKGRETKRIIVE